MTSRDLSATKRALIALQEMQQKLDNLEKKRREPIAVIGMSCRFPGECNTPESFWKNLCAGYDAIEEIPAQRWDVDTWFHGDPDVPGRMYTRYGAFLHDIHAFDPQFFGISPREAASIDPQQRILLELAWEALENANIAPDALYGSRTGVYAGIANFEYGAHLLWSGDATRITSHAGTGGSLGVAAGRLSYTLGLTGPSMTVDTACSSSLVTTHLACQALRLGECDMALSAGVNLFFGPETHINFCKARMLAPDGRCKTFDAAADGYGRGEGAGVVLLKRWSDARRDKNRVLALIRGSAVNQDGPSGALTVPNGPAQQRVMTQALNVAGVKPEQVGYVEAHGTGTALGDPIEVRALGNVYGSNRNRNSRKSAPAWDKDGPSPLKLGCVKTNTGHLEAAAGIAGLIKTILIVQQGRIPPHIHLKQPTPHIPWQELPLHVPTRLQPWEATERIAGVSSFSFSGTNAHVIISNTGKEQDDTSADDKINHKAPQPTWQLLPLSAGDQVALNALLQQYRESAPAWDKDGISWTEVCRTAALGRSQLPWRRALVARGIPEITGDNVRTVKGRAQNSPDKVAFIFTGQGQQYTGMGLELYDQSPVFRQALNACDLLLKPRLGHSLMDIINNTADRGENLNTLKDKNTGKHLPNNTLKDKDAGENLLSNTAFIQPAMFALEYALIELWRSWGIRPHAVLGHNVGEYAAACAADVLSLKNAMNLITSCSKGIQQLPLPPGSVLPSLTKVADAIDYQEAQMPLYSCITGDVAGREMATADYWMGHPRESGAFARGMAALLRDGYRTFVEIGPRSTLCTLGHETAADLDPSMATECLWLPSLGSGHGEYAQMLESLGQLWVNGAEVDWNAVAGPGRCRARLPNYPFQRSNYKISWLGTSQPSTPVAHTGLLGHALHSPALPRNVRIFSPALDPDTMSLFMDHRIFGAVVLPAAGHLELGLEAGERLLPSSPSMLEDISIEQPLVLTESDEHAVQMVLNGANDGYNYEIYSGRENSWTLHSRGRVRPDHTAPPPPVDLEAVQQQCAKPLSVVRYYEKTHAAGIEHGRKFQALTHLWEGEGMVLARLELPQAAAMAREEFQLHPVLLDAALQAAGALLLKQGKPYLPTAIDRLHRYRQSPSILWCLVRPCNDNGQTHVVTRDLYLMDDEGNLVAVVQGLHFQRMEHGALLHRDFPHGEWLLHLNWIPRPLWSPHGYWIPAPGDTAAALMPDMHGALEEVGFYRDLTPKLNHLSSVYAQCALAQDPTMESSVLPEHQPLFRRLGSILGEQAAMAGEDHGENNGHGQRQSHTFVPPALTDINNDTPKEMVMDLQQRFPGAEAELTLLSRCGQGLAGVLKGTLDPLKLLFPDKDTGSAEHLYAESLGAVAMNTLVAKAVLHLLRQLPRENQVRILEIGAGTGSTTAHVLPHLPRGRSRYIFTDISTMFTGKARERFSRYDFMEFRTLDIETDPGQQGFPDNGFDIVIAANVLHATCDIHETLNHVHQVLAPGGMLVLVEGTTPQPWLDLVFGLTRGWWRFTDVELRNDYPLMDVEHWSASLNSQGFNEVDIISPDRAAGETVLGQSLLLARKAPAPPPSTAPLTSTATLTSAATSALSGEEWLVIADKNGVGACLATLLRAHGICCTLLNAETIISEPLKSLVQQIDSHQNLHTIVHAAGCSMIPLDTLNTQGLNHAQQIGCRSLLQLVQALEHCAASTPPALCIATRGAAPVTGFPCSGLSQATLWAMGQVVAKEYPEFCCTHMDLDPEQGDPESAAQTLLRLLKHRPEEPLALRRGMCHVPRLNHLNHLQPHGNGHGTASPSSHSSPLTVRKDAAYLITGGLGDLGLLTARWLVEKQGARAVALAGRTAPDAHARKHIEELEKLGASIHVITTDVTDPKQVTAAVAAARHKGVPLKGVIHAAGNLNDGMLASQDWERFASVLGPKVTGAWNLHNACRNLTLDFFIMYSSMASQFAPPTQASHAAANAFLDALTVHRRNLRLPAMTINWGAWSEIGQAARKKMDKQLAVQGMGTISPQQGLKILSHLFEHPIDQVTVAPVDWSRFTDRAGELALVRHLSAPPETPPTPLPTPSMGHPWGKPEELAKMPIGERYVRIMDLIKIHTAQVLGLESPQWVKEDTGFFAQGMDSLTAMELRNALQDQLGQTMGNTLIFKYPTVPTLARYLAENIPGPEAAPSSPDEPRSPSPATSSTSHEQTLVEDITSMSEEELALMIDGELNELLDNPD